MNGGRLSDDEAFFLGLQQFRKEMAAEPVDQGALARALRMIAVRFPEEAGELQEEVDALTAPAIAPDLQAAWRERLTALETLYSEEFAE